MLIIQSFWSSHLKVLSLGIQPITASLRVKFNIARSEKCTTMLDNTGVYVGYSESKYRPRISLAHPRDCHFAHVQ